MNVQGQQPRQLGRSSFFFLQKSDNTIESSVRKTPPSTVFSTVLSGTLPVARLDDGLGNN